MKYVLFVVGVIFLICIVGIVVGLLMAEEYDDGHDECDEYDDDYEL